MIIKFTEVLLSEFNKILSSQVKTVLFAALY